MKGVHHYARLLAGVVCAPWGGAGVFALSSLSQFPLSGGERAWESVIRLRFMSQTLHFHVTGSTNQPQVLISLPKVNTLRDLKGELGGLRGEGLWCMDKFRHWYPY